MSAPDVERWWRMRKKARRWYVGNTYRDRALFNFQLSTRRKSNCKCRECGETIKIGEDYVWTHWGKICLACINEMELISEGTK